MIRIELTDRQHLQILAALRRWQQDIPEGLPILGNKPRPSFGMVHYNDEGAPQPLNSDQIDDLCVKINLSPETKIKSKTQGTKRIIDRAKKMYHKEGEIEIDDNAKISEGDTDGCYVEAWVWLPKEETRP